MFNVLTIKAIKSRSVTARIQQCSFITKVLNTESSSHPKKKNPNVHNPYEGEWESLYRKKFLKLYFETQF